MDLLETYYDKRTFTLYALFVAVPGKSVWKRKIFIIISTLALSFFTASQILKLVIDGFQFRLIIELLPTITATAGTLVYLLYTAYATGEDYKKLLSAMLSNLKEDRTEEEEAIKKQYAKGAQIFIDVYTTMLLVGMGITLMAGFTPYLLDLLIPLNESRELQLLTNGEMFIDQEKYFCYIYILQNCTVWIICIVVGVSENMSVIISQHLCGMFAVIGHQMENITEVKRHPLVDKINYGDLVTRKLQACIERHQRSLQFATLAVGFYDVPLTIVLISTFCALTISLVEVTDPELINLEIVVYTALQVCQFFIVSCMGQFVINASERVSENAYNAKWDICEPNTRKLLQMIIMRSSRPCQVVARRMYTLSIENFMSVIQTATSFYMVLRQST